MKRGNNMDDESDASCMMMKGNVGVDMQSEQSYVMRVGSIKGESDEEDEVTRVAEPEYDEF